MIRHIAGTVVFRCWRAVLEMEKREEGLNTDSFAIFIEVFLICLYRWHCMEAREKNVWEGQSINQLTNINFLSSPVSAEYVRTY